MFDKCKTSVMVTYLCRVVDNTCDLLGMTFKSCNNLKRLQIHYTNNNTIIFHMFYPTCCCRAFIPFSLHKILMMIIAKSHSDIHSSAILSQFLVQSSALKCQLLSSTSKGILYYILQILPTFAIQ